MRLIANGTGGSSYFSVVCGCYGISRLGMGYSTYQEKNHNMSIINSSLLCIDSKAISRDSFGVLVHYGQRLSNTKHVLLM